MKLPILEEMFKSGLHLGHKKGRTNPKARKYIFSIRDGIYIIDLEKTSECLEAAINYLAQAVESNKTILFVGAKRQVKEIVKETAEACSMPYVTWRWLGGTLTNFETVQKSLKRMTQLEEELKGERAGTMTKKERSFLEKELAKFTKSFQGVRSLSKLPDVMFVVDTAKEKIAVNEARKMGVPVVGICDTDADPILIDYPIPANDDAKKSVELILNFVKKGLLEARGEKENKPVEIKTDAPAKELAKPVSEKAKKVKPEKSKKIKSKE